MLAADQPVINEHKEEDGAASSVIGLEEKYSDACLRISGLEELMHTLEVRVRSERKMVQ